MNSENILDARGHESNDPRAVAVQAAERAREASRQLEAAYCSGERQRPGWVELGPIEPTPPGQVQVLSRQVYVGPTLADIHERQRKPLPPPPEVSVVEDPPGSGRLNVTVTIPLD